MRVLPVVCALVYAVAGDKFYEDEYYLRNDDVRLQHSREYRRLINKPPQYENGSFRKCINATVYKTDCNECNCVGGKIYLCTLNPCGLNSKPPNGGNNRENLALFTNTHAKSRYNKYVLHTGLKWISKVYAKYSAVDWLDYLKNAYKNRNAKVIFYYNTNPRQYAIYKKHKNGKHSIVTHPEGISKKVKIYTRVCKPDDWVILECMTCLCLEGSLGLCYWNFCEKYGVHKHANIVDHDGDGTYDDNDDDDNDDDDNDDDDNDDDDNDNDDNDDDQNKNVGKNKNQNDKGGKNNNQNKKRHKKNNKNKNGGKNNNVINNNQSNKGGKNNIDVHIQNLKYQSDKTTNQHNLGSTGK